MRKKTRFHTFHQTAGVKSESTRGQRRASNSLRFKQQCTQRRQHQISVLCLSYQRQTFRRCSGLCQVGAASCEHVASNKRTGPMVNIIHYWFYLLVTMDGCMLVGRCGAPCCASTAPCPTHVGVYLYIVVSPLVCQQVIKSREQKSATLRSILYNQRHLSHVITAARPGRHRLTAVVEEMWTRL